MPLRVFLLICLSLASVAPSPAHALPRYAAAYGQDCNLCHHDPTGGGLRSTYATQYLIPTELAWRASDALEEIEPSIGEHVLLGADLRWLASDAEDRPSQMFTMQTDVHLVLQMDERTSVAIDLGSGRRSEAYGLLRGPPAQGWLKAGRFVPAYGWRFADHQIFTRRHLLTTTGSESPVVWKDSGLEIGLSPGRTQIAASLQAAAGEIGESWTARVVHRRRLGGLEFAAGASALRRHDGSSHRAAHGALASAHAGPWTWLGQADVVRAEDRRREWIVSQQLGWTVTRGWTALLSYDFHDPDRDRANGARRRWGVGVDTLLTPFVGVTVWARYDQPEEGSSIAGTERLGGDLVLHILF